MPSTSSKTVSSAENVSALFFLAVTDVSKVLVIGAVSSGCGKTTLTLGLMAALRVRGLTVQSYKVGPDYIDTSYHALASGRPSHNLDSWLVPINKLRSIFESAIGDADIAIVEGVMGLYDGGRRGISSTAEIAKLLNAPVVLVVDAKSIGASAAAIALGFREYDRELELAGVLLNRIGSPTHRQMIEDALSAINIKCFGALKRDERFVIPERHLGLLMADENPSLDFIEELGRAVEAQIDVDGLIDSAREIILSPTVERLTVDKKCRIGIARDEAFSFYYPESLMELKRLGAELTEFSPLHDEILPTVDGLILGGGYPEMFASELERNVSMRQSIAKAASTGMPIYAECGGYMYLMRELIGFDGRRYEMCGVFDGRAAMNERLQMVGYMEAELMSDCVIGRRGDVVRAHEFHFSSADVDAKKIFRCTRLRTEKVYEAGAVKGNVVGSYLHLHFAGCPTVAKNFISHCSIKN